ncbi:MAG: metallophosphoesterase [Desulfobacterales bacterium]|nr:MAG: metallophosphoesterase [Desulfobacterales bacterium]
MVETLSRFVGILGDAACRAGWQTNFPRLAELLWEQYRPSHVFVPGDMTAYGTPAQHEEILEYCHRHPWEWVVAMGDHDRPVHVFERYWGPSHKVTDIGRWRFIGVDTASWLFTAAEALWLREQIKDDSIIYTHMPPGITGWEFHSLDSNCTARFFAVLDDFHDQVRACFFGHIHSYDRREYRGIPLIVTGAGGAEARGLGENGYKGTRPFQAMAFDTTTGEIILLEDTR